MALSSRSFQTSGEDMLINYRVTTYRHVVKEFRTQAPPGQGCVTVLSTAMSEVPRTEPVAELALNKYLGGGGGSH